MTTRYDKTQNVAHRLNYEASQRQVKGAKQFTPCARATVLIQAGRGDAPLPAIMIDAYNTPCGCHSDRWIPFSELQDWTLDDSHKRRHYGEL